MARHELVTPLGDSAMDETTNALRIVAATATGTVGMTGVTTNTTSSTFTVQGSAKTFWAEVVGTGAVTADVSFYGARTSTAANGVLLATISLSGTTRTQDAAGASLAPYPYYYIVTTGVTGTGATVQAEIFSV